MLLVSLIFFVIKSVIDSLGNSLFVTIVSILSGVLGCVTCSSILS